MQPTGQGVEVHDLASCGLHALGPAAGVADDDIGIDVLAREEERQGGKGRTVVAAQRGDAVDGEATHVGLPELGIRALGPVERGEHRRVGIRPQHRDEYPLAAAALHKMVVDERHRR